MKDAFTTVQLPVRLPELDNAHPDYLARPVPAHCPPLHILAAIIGGRGSGKTTFALKLIKLYDKAKSFDRIIVFSTTAEQDPKMKSFLNSKTYAELSYHKGFTEATLRDEMDQMEADLEAWRDYQRKLKIWNKFVAHHHNVDAMEIEELHVLDEQLDFTKPKPPNKSGMYPCHLVVFDDLVGTRVFNPNMTGVGNRLLISHRHLSASVLVLSQTFTSFIPKQVRANNIGLWVLFQCKSDKAMADIAEDVSSKVSPAEFIAAWKYATDVPHRPFICDYDTPDPARRFRAGLDKLIVLHGTTNIVGESKDENGQAHPP